MKIQPAVNVSSDILYLLTELHCILPQTHVHIHIPVSRHALEKKQKEKPGTIFLHLCLSKILTFLLMV